MPNWTQNSLLIPKSSKTLFNRKFLSHVKKGKSPLQSFFDFNKVVRQPLNLGLDESGIKNPSLIINWCRNHWGTKWGACESDFTTHTTGKLKGFYEISFTTANGALCETFLTELSQKLRCTVEHYYLSEEDDVFGYDNYLYADEERTVYVSNEEESEELKKNVNDFFYNRPHLNYIREHGLEITLD